MSRDCLQSFFETFPGLARSAIATGLLVLASLFSAESLTGAETINLWPGKPPGDTSELPPEADTSGPDGRNVAGKSVIRLGNVSTPQLTITSPPADKNTGAAIVICPGGGHRILAYDLEGTEVADWLVGQGVTAVVLKYRVPGRNPEQMWKSGADDAQRAISLLRQNAERLKVDPNRIGILGFSAGGEIAARTALAKERGYAPVDKADELSPRPNFAVLIYPAYLAEKDGSGLRADVIVDKTTPPMFLVHAHDDPVTPLSSVYLYAALKQSGIPSELHVFSRGGHGYGLRATEHAVTGWPALLGVWLKDSGWLKPMAQ